MAIVPSKDNSDYSPSWKWENDEELEGTHREFRTATIPERGTVVVWEIEHDEHGPVSVWVEPANLKARLQRELRNRLRERGNSRLEAGERVRINPGTKRPSKRNPGQTVWPFANIEFEHGAPDLTAEELLLTDDEAAEEAGADDSPPLPDKPPPKDDIPF